MIKQMMAATVLCGLALGAQAQESDVHQTPGVYAGGAILRSDLDIDVDGIGSVGTDDWGLQVLAGYRFNPYFAIEGSYTDAGSFGFAGGGDSVSVDPTLLAVSGVVGYPVADRLSIFARLSAVRWDADVTVRFGGQTESASDDGTEFGYGIGAQYAFGQLATRISYDVVDIGEEGVDFELSQLSLAFIWKF